MESLQEDSTKGATAATWPGRNRLGCVVAVCSWLCLLIVVAIWAVLYAGDLWWPATLILFSPRWLLAIPLFPLSLAAAYWRPRSLVVVLLSLLLVLGPIASFNLPWRTAFSTPPPGERLRVLTCNIHHQAPNPAAVEQLLAEADPDIVAIQELSSRVPFDYFARDQWHVHRVSGLFLASRYRIRKAEQLGSQSVQVKGLTMRYELETPAGLVTLFSVHLASPREGLYQSTHHPTTGTNDLEENSDMRWRQSKHLVALADQVPGPVLLVGDFNTPVHSAIFRRVWGGYLDAFTQAGWGWGYTFLGARTTVRIDHILAGRGWYCERCWVAPSIGSPHHPVLADLILAEPSP